MNKKRLVLRCCLVTVLGLGACCGQTPDPPDSRTVRLPATADIWLSDAMPQERTSSAGKHPRMKLKNIQEMGAIRFDATAAAGYQVRAARLFLRRAGQDKLRYLRISTINQDWTEGNSHVSYGPADGATFLAASVEGEKSRPWAWPGSSFADVTMSSGNTLGCWAARKEHDDGWISVPLTADLIYALTTGDTDGLAVMDGGNPANFNNFIFTKESGPNAPYIEVALGEPLTAVPKKPVVSATAAPERAGLGQGAVRISIEADPDVFCWQLRRDGQPVPRWQVKHPARSGPTVFYLEDLQPRHTYRLEVTATSRGAKRSPPAEMTVRSSPAMPVDAGLGKFVRTEVKRTRTPSNGPLAVWPLPG
ncbi:MAG: hypothetical protein HQ581_22800, partial [Planctomycetes bacterium]|nr:hypothetical protein [Planctomycetota bacterium]